METLQSAPAATGDKTHIIITDTEIFSTKEPIVGNGGLVFEQSLTWTLNDSSSQLSAKPKTNDEPGLLNIPREIISASISSTKLQAELLRPLISGTYFGKPAYLLHLQIAFKDSSGGRDWLKRIQSAEINVLLQDAPRYTEGQQTPPSKARRRPGKSVQTSTVKHPSIEKTYPGSEDWHGPISSIPITTNIGAGLQAGWEGIGANANWSESRSKTDIGSAKVSVVRSSTGSGSQRNNVFITVLEDPVEKHGIHSHLIVPMIVTHHSRRFQMRVTVHATFGVWRGALAKSYPVLGRADEPLFFDPDVLREKEEAGERGDGGLHVVVSGDKLGYEGAKLEEVDLAKHSSLFTAE
jgi:hypothetical protein